MPFLNNIPVIPNYNTNVLMFVFLKHPELLNSILTEKQRIQEDIADAAGLSHLSLDDITDRCPGSHQQIHSNAWSKLSAEYKGKFSLDEIYQTAATLGALFDKRDLQLSIGDLLSEEEFGPLQIFISDLLTVKAIDSIPTEDGNTVAALFSISRDQKQRSIKDTIESEHAKTPKIYQEKGAYLQPLFHLFHLTILKKVTLDLFQRLFQELKEKFQKDFPHDPEENSRLNYLLDDLMVYLKENTRDNDQIKHLILQEKKRLIPQLSTPLLNTENIPTDILNAQNHFMATLMPDDLPDIVSILNEVNGFISMRYIDGVLEKLATLLEKTFVNSTSCPREETFRKAAYYLMAIAHANPSYKTNIFNLTMRYRVLNAYCAFLRGDSSVQQHEQRIPLPESTSRAIDDFLIKNSDTAAYRFLVKFKAEIRDDQHRTYRQIIETLEAQYKLRSSQQSMFSTDGPFQNLLDEICQLDNRRQDLPQGISDEIDELMIQYTKENNKKKFDFLSALTKALQALETKHLPYKDIIAKVEKLHPGQAEKGILRSRMYDLLEKLRKLDNNPSTSASPTASASSSSVGRSIFSSPTNQPTGNTRRPVPKK